MPNMPDIKLTRTDEIFKLNINKINYTGKCHFINSHFHSFTVKQRKQNKIVSVINQVINQVSKFFFDLSQKAEKRFIHSFIHSIIHSIHWILDVIPLDVIPETLLDVIL